MGDVTVAATPLLDVARLSKSFPAGRGLLGRSTGEVRALDGVSFDVARGETLGIVGESGCGKSTLARCILRLIEPSSGSVFFDGVDILALAPSAMRQIRRRMQIVFQDATGSLDPRMSVRRLVEEPLATHGLHAAAERRRRVDDMLLLVGIQPSAASGPPSRFSGGQRQRIGLARALVLEPQLLVLDEPVSALDVSVQAQILNLLRDLQERFGLTYLFIVHDLSVAEFFCDRVAVLYLGRIMEIAGAEALFREACHPYTVSLLSAMPLPTRRHERERIVLRGEVSPLGVGSVQGCPFQPRCPVGRDREICRNVTPLLASVADRHHAACHFPGAPAA
jgi:oligopeptide/dipeptide ABC transporter ATP-binding protein